MLRRAGMRATADLRRVVRPLSSIVSAPEPRTGGGTGHSWKTVAYWAAGGVAVGTFCNQVSDSSVAHQDAAKRRPNLPEYPKEEISKHTTKEAGIWVTYQGSVYDVTDFVDGHPGGNKILLAAGGALEPFWNLYAVHQNAEVYKMLAPMKIGRLKASDQKAAIKLDDPYANDPERHPALKVNSQRPFNAEPPEELLTDAFITPNELFFTRNHLPVPDLKANDFALEVEVEGLSKPLKFTLDDLKRKFEHVTVTATLQCAGNRRAELAAKRPVKGLTWTGNAISNATWTGVRLRDVLLAAGVKDKFEAQELAHVHFEGHDKDITNQTYQASILIDKAMDPRGDVILAFEMNGKPLPRDHGYPLRIVAPGIVAARQVKWVKKVVASKNESQGFWQQKDYKSFSPATDWSDVDFSKAPAIQETPVTSMITQVEGVEEGGPLNVKGFAYSGGGRGIVRVDVSIDGGKTWRVANLDAGAEGWKKANYNRNWTWALWSIDVPEELLAQRAGKELQIVAKATDTSYNVQPETPEPYWNLRGVCYNGWPRVTVKVPEAMAAE